MYIKTPQMYKTGGADFETERRIPIKPHVLQKDVKDDHLQTQFTLPVSTKTTMDTSTQHLTSSDDIKTKLSKLFNQTIMMDGSIFSNVYLTYKSGKLTFKSNNPVVTEIITLLESHPIGTFKYPIFVVEKTQCTDVDTKEIHEYVYVRDTNSRELSTMCDNIPENVSCLERYANVLNVLIKHCNVLVEN